MQEIIGRHLTGIVKRRLENNLFWDWAWAKNSLYPLVDG